MTILCAQHCNFTQLLNNDYYFLLMLFILKNNCTFPSNRLAILDLKSLKNKTRD